MYYSLVEPPLGKLLEELVNNQILQSSLLYARVDS